MLFKLSTEHDNPYTEADDEWLSDQTAAETQAQQRSMWGGVCFVWRFETQDEDDPELWSVAAHGTLYSQ